MRSNQQYGKDMKAAHESLYGAVPKADRSSFRKKIVELDKSERNRMSPKSKALNKKCN